MSNERVTIIGAGGVGSAMAADLTLAGHEVTLYEMPEFSKSIEPIIKAGGINLIAPGRGGFAKISKTTTDIKEAVKDTKVIFVAQVGWGHRHVAELSAPYLEDGQIIIVTGGQFGSLEFRKILKEKRPSLNVIIAETGCAPYGCRREDPDKAESNIRTDMRAGGIAALPAKYNDQVMGEIVKFYPDGRFAAGRNVLEVAATATNILLHPAPIMLMSVWLELTGGSWWDGFTPSVLKVVEATFRERNAVLAALGLRDLWSFEDLKTLIANPEAHKLTGPRDVQHRFVTEDTPMGLVGLTSLGDLAGVPMPLCKAIVSVISAMIGVDYFKEGRNLERMGISGLSIDQLNRFLE